MLTVKVWCLPDVGEERLAALHQAIVRSLVNNVPSQCILSEEDMLVLFPTDMMKYGLGKEILIETTNVIGQASGTVASWIGIAVKKQFPDTRVVSTALSESQLEAATKWDSKYERTPGE